MSSAATHGLAARIRACQENETFDLAGQSAGTVESTMQAAFETPFLAASSGHMIRLTFVTGAGKQARQKYDDAASKTLTTVLQKCGYVEDRGASCVVESAGAYKLQHDTGKNLKTVVVFPKLLAASSKGGDASAQEEAEEALLPKNSPGYKIAVASMKIFPNMLQRECPSWSQKKACLESLHTMQSVLQDLDQQLMHGTPLTSAEQDFYDSVAVQLDEKEAMVKQQLAAHVEQGTITQHEKEVLLQQNAARIQALQSENKSTAKAIERKHVLEAITQVQPPHALKHHNQLGKLYKELAPLQHLDSKGGRLLSFKETKLLTRKEEIVEEIEHLEEASRGWFEDEDTFATRVQASRAAFARQFPHKGAAVGSKKTTISSNNKQQMFGGASRGGGGGVNKWVTPGESGRSGYSSAKKKGKMKKGGGLFQAMMMDSSDEEEEDEAVVEVTASSRGTSTGVVPQAGAAASETADDTAPTQTKSSKKKSKKKKKKSKAKSSNNQDDDEPSNKQELDEDEYLESAVADAQARAKAEEEIQQEAGQTALARTIAFLQAYIFPIIVALLGWFIGLFRKPKKPTKKKRG